MCSSSLSLVACPATRVAWREPPVPLAARAGARCHTPARALFVPFPLRPAGGGRAGQQRDVRSPVRGVPAAGQLGEAAHRGAGQGCAAGEGKISSGSVVHVWQEGDCVAASHGATLQRRPSGGMGSPCSAIRPATCLPAPAVLPAWPASAGPAPNDGRPKPCPAEWMEAQGEDPAQLTYAQLMQRSAEGGNWRRALELFDGARQGGDWRLCV